MLPPQEEKEVRAVFYISLVLKGLHAILEILGGALLFFVSTQVVVFVTNFFTLTELTEDPHDIIANYLRHSAEAFTLGGKTFAALYLLSHGVVKLFLVAALLKNKLWAYPASLFVFGAFILYQLYRFTHTHSWTLIALSIFDAIVLWLIWHEYRVVVSKQPKGL